MALYQVNLVSNQLITFPDWALAELYRSPVLDHPLTYNGPGQLFSRITTFDRWVHCLEPPTLIPLVEMRCSIKENALFLIIIKGTLYYIGWDNFLYALMSLGHTLIGVLLGYFVGSRRCNYLLGISKENIFLGIFREY